MARNRGNTGNSGYKMQKCTAVEGDDKTYRIVLACGHQKVDSVQLFGDGTLVDFYDSRQKWIGMRFRCEDCRKITATAGK
jgi:hypothetical protein